MAYYLFCNSTVFDTRITYQEVSCCLYKLSVLTQRFFFFFYNLFIFESMDKSTLRAQGWKNCQGLQF